MKVTVETYGCATNQADGEVMAGLLAEHGFSVGADGDVLVVNSCTVKTPTENKIRRRLTELSGRRVVVAGCIPAGDESIVDDFPDLSFIGTNTQDVVAAVEAAAGGGRYVNVGSGASKICLPRIRRNPIVEIVPILEGCLGSCNYCLVRKARGKLVSYPVDLIVDRGRDAVSDGAREIWLTSQDNGAYGKDKESSLAELMNAVSEIDGDFKVRVGMANPNHVRDILDNLVDSFSDERFYRFLHVPVQTGSDKVLKDMGRMYTVDEFKRIVEAFRRKYDMCISTDVIAGYPTESEEAFQDTVSLIEDVTPDVLNVSRYWARAGTPAAKMKPLPGSETKRRSRILNDVFKKVGLERNKKWVGWMGECLASQKNQDGTYTVRNTHHKPIVVESGKEILGQSVSVKVETATYYDLRGEINPKT